jgi:hypothetical protein
VNERVRRPILLGGSTWATFVAGLADGSPCLYWID